MSDSSLAKKLALWKPGWTTDFQAARISLPELLLPSSHFFLFLPVAFNLTRAPAWGGAALWGRHWPAFAPWAVLWGMLPAECLQWSGLTQQEPLNRALRLSCNINPKNNSYVDKLQKQVDKQKSHFLGSPQILLPKGDKTYERASNTWEKCPEEEEKSPLKALHSATCCLVPVWTINLKTNIWRRGIEVREVS